MSVKKLLILTAAGIASVGMTAAIAGGPTVMAPPAPVEDSYFYVEGNIGYASQDFAGTTYMGPVAMTALGAGSQGGWAYGADIGYMFNQYIGLEAGWTYLPRFATTVATTAATTGNYTLRSTNGTWFVVKLVAPLTERLDAFFKAGIGYRYGRILWNAMAVAPFGGSSQMQELRPLFAVGGAYHFGQSWMMNVQFMHFMGGTTYTSGGPTLVLTSSVIAPASNVLTLGVGYKFTV